MCTQVRVFGGIKDGKSSIDSKRALTIANSILAGARARSSTSTSALDQKLEPGTRHREVAKSLDFSDYVFLTGGTDLAFDDFLKLTAGQTYDMSASQKALAVGLFTKEKDKVARGIKIDEKDEKDGVPAAGAGAGAGTGAGAVPQPVQQPSRFMVPSFMQTRVPQARPPTTVACFNCKRSFGVPPGASAVKCPHCHVPNSVQAVVQTA